MRHLKENRSWLVVILLSIITGGIYGMYLIHVMARDTNIACAKDGKHTAGLVKYIIFSIITLFIYTIVWEIKIISRWQNLAETESEKPVYSVMLYVLLTFIGGSTFICPLIASYKRIAGFNQICRIYNDTDHTVQKGNPADNYWGWKKDTDNKKQGTK